MRSWLFLPVIFLAISCKPDEEQVSAKMKTLATSSTTWQDDVLAVPGPVLVDFSATWCGPCRAMEPILASIAKDFPVKTVDVDKQPELAKLYQIRSLPTLMVFVGGELKWREVGYTGEAALRAELKRFSQKP